MQPRKFDSGERTSLNPLTGHTRLLLWFAAPLMLVGCSQEGHPFDSKQQPSVVDPSVFISEFHYDNLGADIGEGVEVSGIAGTDLSEFTIVLYNGESGAPYRVFSLSGVIPDHEGGRGSSVLTLPGNGMQNGSPDGVALVHSDATLGETVLEFLSYEGSFTATSGPAKGLTSQDVGVKETPSSPVGESLQLIQQGAAMTWTGPIAETFGALNGGSGSGDSGDEEDDSDEDNSAHAPMLGSCGDSSTAISTVQGPGSSSSLSGQPVELEGVVVGDFPGREHLRGFFVQSEVPDTDPLTSEGVFVFAGESTFDVALGQKVRVAGTVHEDFGLTQVSARAVLDCGVGTLPDPTALPLATALKLATGDVVQLEALEGMRVTASDLIATETYDLARYGEVTLSASGRLFNPANGTAVGPADNARRRILLDDGSELQNPESIPYLSPDKTLRLGDRLPSLDAILSFSFGTYRLHPIARENVNFVRDNPRTQTPPDVGGDIRVASLNVLNYFTTLGERGANSRSEFERQRAKLVSTIVALDADVLGLMEIENDSATARRPQALDNLVAAVNASLGGEIYARAPDPRTTGSDVIRTALIYKRDVLTALDLSIADESPIHNRLPIAQEFSYQGHDFSVVVNHFKSKTSCPKNSSDPNADHGQGCWNALRTEQATALLAFISQLKKASRSQDVVVLGDLNSYPLEDPITTLRAGGLTHLIAELPEHEQYSYSFNGEAGVLDYAFTTPSLEVTGTTIWHINADEPRFLDYNTEANPPFAFSPDPFRSSDHDPVVIGLSWESSPLRLMTNLIATTQGYARDARLHWRTHSSWTTLLRRAEISLAEGFEVQVKRPQIARRYFADAEQRLKTFEVQVALHTRYSSLSADPARDLLDRSQTLRRLIATPLDGEAERSD